MHLVKDENYTLDKIVEKQTMQYKQGGSEKYVKYESLVHLLRPGGSFIY